MMHQSTDPASEAQRHLAAALEEVSLRPSSYMSCGQEVHPRRKSDDPVRMLLAVAGTGSAVLALGDSLAEDRASARLACEADVVRAEIGRADAKCGVLVAITGAAAAFSFSQAHGHGLAHLAGLGAALLFAMATSLALAALRPRLGPAGWCRWARMTADQAIIDIFGTGGGLAATLAALSRIALVKHQLVRAAVDLAAVAFMLAVAGVIA